LHKTEQASKTGGEKHHDAGINPAYMSNIFPLPLVCAEKERDENQGNYYKSH